MVPNVLNMVRAALYSIFFFGFSIFKFTNSLSKYYELRLALYFLCVPSMSSAHPFVSLRKISKIQINFSTAAEWVFNFPEGASPLNAGIKARKY